MITRTEIPPTKVDIVRLNNLPAVMESLPFKMGETTGQFICEKGHELKDIINLPLPNISE